MKDKKIKALIITLVVIVVLFLVTVAIYWFNLDTKAVKLLEKTMSKHYDGLKRDHKL